MNDVASPSLLPLTRDQFAAVGHHDPAFIYKAAGTYTALWPAFVSSQLQRGEKKKKDK